MKKLLLFTCSFFLVAIASAQSWRWTRHVSDSVLNTLYGSSLAVVESERLEADRQGNIYVALSVRVDGWIDDYRDLLLKYDRNGYLLWSHHFTDPSAANDGNIRAHVYDMKAAPDGSLYLLMRSFQTCDGAPLANVGTANMLLKVDGSGGLVWSKPVSSIEGPNDWPRSAKLAASPTADHFYALVSPGVYPFRFLDSTYNVTSPGSRQYLMRIDSSGRIRGDLKAISVTSVSLAVNAQDQVLLMMRPFPDYSYTAASVGDTSFTLPSAINIPGHFFLLRGSNFSRVWARRFGLVDFITDFEVYNASFVGSSIAVNQEFIREDFEPAQNRYYVGADTVPVSLSNVIANPYILLLDSNGRYRHQIHLSVSDSVTTKGTNIVSDGQGNLYFGAMKLYPGFNVLYEGEPMFCKADTAGVLHWRLRARTELDNIDVPQVAYTEDGGYFLTRVRGSAFSMNPAFGPDTLSLPQSLGNIDALSAVGEQPAAVRGTVFYDLDGDGVQSATEPGIGNMPVHANNGAYQTFTDRTGRYLLVLDPGTYTVTTSGLRYHRVRPAQYNVTFPVANNTQDSRNFGLQPDTSVVDAGIELTPFGAVRPGQETYLSIAVRNNSIVPRSGTYGLKFPVQVQYVAADSTPVLVQADSLAWSYSNLAPGATRVNTVRLRPATSTGMGQLLRITGTVNPYAADSAKADNIDSVFLQVTSSFDPNDKQVAPFHVLRVDSVQNAKIPLEYTLRFQNTGNDTAFTIRIEDTLSSWLNPATVRLLGSSHRVELQWKGANLLRFHFENILLPDLHRDERGSHGFVKFSVLPKTNVTASDSIVNKAAIYFDYNAPVITNKVVTRFRTSTVTAVPVFGPDAYTMVLFPNPAGNVLHCRISGAAAGRQLRVVVRNADGVQIGATRPMDRSGNVEIPLVGIPAGTYFLEVQDGKSSRFAPFVR